jgi:hypothetical protein
VDQAAQAGVVRRVQVEHVARQRLKEAGHPGVMALSVGLCPPSHCLLGFGHPVLRKYRCCNYLNRAPTSFPHWV